VLKLSNSYRLDPSQLVAQAETIHQLAQERELITRELAEERERWEAERQGWSRMAEALIVKRRTGPESYQQEVCYQLDLLHYSNKWLVGS
jgi:hypothetical protein